MLLEVNICFRLRHRQDFGRLLLLNIRLGKVCTHLQQAHHGDGEQVATLEAVGVLPGEEYEVKCHQQNGHELYAGVGVEQGGEGGYHGEVFNC